MVEFYFSLTFQDIEKNLKQIRLQNINESKIPEQKYKAKVIYTFVFCFHIKKLPGSPFFFSFYFMELPAFVMSD